MGKDSRKVLSALKAQLQTTTVTSKFGELRTNVGIPKLKKAIKSVYNSYCYSISEDTNFLISPSRHVVFYGRRTCRAKDFKN